MPTRTRQHLKVRERATERNPVRQDDHMTAMNGRRWNHNIHYHPRVLDAVPGAHRPRVTLTRPLTRVGPAAGVDAAELMHAA